MSVKFENIAPLTPMESMLAEILNHVASKNKIAPLLSYEVTNEFGHASVMQERVTQASISSSVSFNDWKERIASNLGNEYTIPVSTELSEFYYLLAVSNAGILTELINVETSETVYLFDDKSDMEISTRLGAILLAGQMRLGAHMLNHLAHKERQLNSTRQKPISP